MKHGESLGKNEHGTRERSDNCKRPSVQVCVIGVPENGAGIGRRMEILFEDILAELFKI